MVGGLVAAATSRTEEVDAALIDHGIRRRLDKQRRPGQLRPPGAFSFRYRFRRCIPVRCSSPPNNPAKAAST